jgi:hypothetical protein
VNTAFVIVSPGAGLSISAASLSLPAARQNVGALQALIQRQVFIESKNA